MVSDEGNQGNVTCALNSDPQGPLVLGANSGAAARFDFRPVGNEPPDLLDVLVVNELDVFDTESANTTPRHKPSPGPPAGTSSRPTSRPSGTSARASRWSPALGSVRRPVGRSCFGCHTYRFLLNIPVLYVVRLERQIVGLVIRRLTVSALSSPIAAPVSITAAFVFAAAA